MRYPDVEAGPARPTGGGERAYAVAGIGATPLGIESAGRERPDLDGNGKADVLPWTGRGYIVLMESPSQARTRISDAQPDGKGLLAHEVESEFQAGRTRVEVLLPEDLEEGRRYPVVYVLPVEAGSNHRYGDGLAEIKKIDAHNRYKIICVAPTFSHMPWYADHPTDPAIRQESHFVRVVVPMIERRYPAVPTREGRLLLGFSKSGWGAYSLLLRHPGVFDRAVAWDAPLLGRNLMDLDAGPIFGTKENLDRYRITSLLESNARQLGKHERLILLGYDSFRRDHQAIHARLEQWRIPHHYRDGPRRRHDWHSGWVAEAVRLLVGPTLRSMKYTSRSEDRAIAWQEELRSELARLLEFNDLITGETRIPFRSRTLSSEKRKEYVYHEMELSSTPGRRIKIVLTVPTNLEGPFPAVVCIAGHGGKKETPYEPGRASCRFAHLLAERGYVTISTAVGQHEIYEEGRTLMGERLWDLMRCVDLLTSREEVDPRRIGCAGLSLGGEMAMWLGAMDERVKATASSGFLTRMDQLEKNHCMCWKFPGLRELVDFADIYSMSAPRALLCQNGLKERPTWFTVPIAREALTEINVIYADFDKPEDLVFVAHEGGHVIDVPSLLTFFEKRLEGSD